MDIIDIRKELIRVKKRLLRLHYEKKIGHVGGNLSCIDLMVVLFHDILKSSDKFVLSKGHSAGAYYCALWSRGLITEEQLESFHQEGTLFPGHVPYYGLPHLDFGTGSLGHGLPLAIGTAMGLSRNHQDGHVYCILSDGDLNEGSTWEALLFLQQCHIRNLSIIVDSNKLQGFDFTTDVMSPLSLIKNFDKEIFDVIELDGHNLEAIVRGLKEQVNKTKIMIANTIKGNGIPGFENTIASHYLPLSEDLYKKALEKVEAL